MENIEVKFPNGTIQYEEMIRRFSAGGSTPFRLLYVVSQGKNAGQVREYNAWYGAPNPKTRGYQQPATAAEKTRKRHIDSGNIPFTQFSTQKLLTLFSFNIIGFNGRQVIS